MFLRECILKDFFYFNDSTYLNEERKKKQEQNSPFASLQIKKKWMDMVFGVKLARKESDQLLS